MSEANIFIKGDVNSLSGTVYTDFEGKVLILTLMYCKQACPFKLNIVNIGNASQDYQHSLVENVTGLLAALGKPYTIDTKECCPTQVLRCSFPCVMQTSQYIISGLCQVLRAIVKNSSSASPFHTEILGHKGNCLQACSQVSVWTKLCEVEFPATVVTFCGNLEKGQSAEFPQCILKLESHFKEPPLVSNISKRLPQNKGDTENSYSKSIRLSYEELQRRDRTGIKSYKISVDGEDIAKQLGRSGAGTDKDNGAVEKAPYGQWRGIAHMFVEGMDCTLCDLIAFPCVLRCITYARAYGLQLDDRLPCVLDWLERMQCDILQRYLEPNELSALLDSCSPSAAHTAGHVTINDHSDSDIGLREPKLMKNHFKITLLRAALDIVDNKHLQLGLKDHPALDKLPLKWQQLPPAIHPHKGNLPAKRVQRKCQQLENLALATCRLARPGNVIVDFCSGSGHLGILLAYLLPECHVIMAENKEASIQNKCFERIKELDLQNITVYQCNLDYLQCDFDIGVCLHGCGVATDMVLARCAQVKASFVVTPCCYGSIRSSDVYQYPRSQHFNTAGISSELLVNIGHAADQTEGGITQEGQGRRCMAIVDSDRLLFMQEAGYTTRLSRLEPIDCSPKHMLLTGYIQT